jgi:hypothetical protein
MQFVAISGLIGTLLFILLLGYYFDRFGIRYVPLAGVALMIGGVMGLVVRGLG